MSAIEGKADRLSAEELGRLAERLASTADPAEAALLRERLTRGYYGMLLPGQPAKAQRV